MFGTWSRRSSKKSSGAEDPLPPLSRQLVVMSEIAWTKHRRVQWSLTLAVAGCTAFALATVVG
ncbi:hypothetical protein SHIRM173S_13020 [Streptomyces hirsutus]